MHLRLQSSVSRILYATKRSFSMHLHYDTSIDDFAAPIQKLDLKEMLKTQDRFERAQTATRAQQHSSRLQPRFDSDRPDCCYLSTKTMPSSLMLTLGCHWSPPSLHHHCGGRDAEEEDPGFNRASPRCVDIIAILWTERDLSHYRHQGRQHEVGCTALIAYYSLHFIACEKLRQAYHFNPRAVSSSMRA